MWIVHCTRESCVRDAILTVGRVDWCVYYDDFFDRWKSSISREYLVKFLTEIPSRQGQPHGPWLRTQAWKLGQAGFKFCLCHRLTDSF